MPRTATADPAIGVPRAPMAALVTFGALFNGAQSLVAGSLIAKDRPDISSAIVAAAEELTPELPSMFDLPGFYAMWDKEVARATEGAGA